MAEGGEVGNEVGAAEEGVGDWGDCLEAEAVDGGRGGTGDGGEEGGGEDRGVDEFAAAIKSYDVGIQGGHCW